MFFSWARYLCCELCMRWKTAAGIRSECKAEWVPGSVRPGGPNRGGCDWRRGAHGCAVSFEGSQKMAVFGKLREVWVEGAGADIFLDETTLWRTKERVSAELGRKRWDWPVRGLFVEMFFMERELVGLWKTGRAMARGRDGERQCVVLNFWVYFNQTL